MHLAGRKGPAAGGLSRGRGPPPVDQVCRDPKQRHDDTDAEHLRQPRPKYIKVQAGKGDMLAGGAPP